jgi:hypothetical protein
MAAATAIQFRNLSHATLAPSDQIRLRALERLYERRDAVDELIGSLERYEDRQQSTRAECIMITAAAK